MKRHVWIVEGDYGGWHPTVGIGLCRDDARAVCKDWAKRNPDDKFRIRKYYNLHLRATRKDAR